MTTNRPIRNLTRLICRVLVQLYEHHSMVILNNSIPTLFFCFPVYVCFFFVYV